MFLPIFALFVLVGILIISTFIAAFSFAIVFFIEGQKGTSTKYAAKKAAPIVAIVFFLSACFCCSTTMIYYLNTPFYLP